MSQSELLKVVVRRLEAAGVDYMLTGSVVSSLRGEPRASHDIDIVIAVRAPAAEVAATFRSAFPEADFISTRTRPGTRSPPAGCST